MEELKSGTLLHLPFPCIADVSTAWEILYETKIIAKHDVNSFETGKVSISTTHDFQDIHSFTFGAGPLPKKCDRLSPFMKLLMTKRALPCQISWDQVLKPESSGGLQVLLPGRLTAGTYKSPIQRKEHDLPNPHDYVPARLIFMGVQDRFFTVDRSEIRRKRTSWGKGSWSTRIYDGFFYIPGGARRISELSTVVVCYGASWKWPKTNVFHCFVFFSPP